MKSYLNLFRWPGLLYCVLIVFLSGSISHANQPVAPTVQAGSELRSLSGHGENFEVILKFSSFKPGSDVFLTAYVLNSATNEPILGATLSGSLSSGSESLPVVFTETPQTLPGAYAGKVTVLSDKPYSWLFDVSLGEKSDLVAIDGFKAGEDSGATPRPAPLEPRKTGYEIKLTPAEIIALIAAFVVLQVAILFFARKRFTFGASEKDPR
ncbi:MAG: hypothetical protein HY881_24260 [Deltaproteobacteria bacterium]|nr:hypothetical protein [Deltaproteobacteria bacterium]